MSTQPPLDESRRVRAVDVEVGDELWTWQGWRPIVEVMSTRYAELEPGNVDSTRYFTATGLDVTHVLFNLEHYCEGAYSIRGSVYIRDKRKEAAWPRLPTR